jgi:uncharacterized protein
MYGGSYVGATQYLAAIANPPHLAGIFPTVTASNYHNGWTYQGGAFEQWFNESWTTGLAENTLERRVDDSGDALDGTKALPLTSYSVLGAVSQTGLAPYFGDWLAHPDYDTYWKQWSIEAHYGDIHVPVYSAGAWYDIFLRGTLRNYMLLKTQAGSEAARRDQRLILFVGGHAGGSDSPRVGALDFGPKLPIDIDALTLRWYDWILKGENNGMENEKPVRIFVMGRNEWRDEDNWPLARAVTTHFYLHSSGMANGVSGDGTLSTSAPATEKRDEYVPAIRCPRSVDHFAAGPCPQELARRTSARRRIAKTSSSTRRPPSQKTRKSLDPCRSISTSAHRRSTPTLPGSSSTCGRTASRKI